MDFYDKIQNYVKKINILIQSCTNKEDSLGVSRLFMIGDGDVVHIPVSITKYQDNKDQKIQKYDDLRGVESVSGESSNSVPVAKGKVLPVGLAAFQSSIPTNKNIKIKTTQIAHDSSNANTNTNGNRILPPDMHGYISNTTFRKLPQYQFKLYVIVSGTASDTAVERKILMGDVYPDLMQYGYIHGLHDVCMIDMSSSGCAIASAGGSSGSGFGCGRTQWAVDNHREWNERSFNVNKGRNESGGMFFLSLQSLKYGLGILPHTIPAVAFDRWLQAALKDSMGVLEACEAAKLWYIRDDNSIPPVVVLQPLTDITRKQYLEEVLPMLLHLFDTMPCLTATGTVIPIDSDSTLYVGRSVGEWETRLATKVTGNRQRCAWFRRQFNQAITYSHDPHSDYSDTHDTHTRARLNELIEYMARAVRGRGNSSSSSGGGGVLRIDFNALVSVDVEVASNCNDTTDSKDTNRTDQSDRAKYDKYCVDFDEFARGSLSEEMNVILSRKHSWEVDGNGLGIPGGVVDGIVHHYNHCKKLCNGFVGRGKMIAAFLEYIQKNEKMKDTGGTGGAGRTGPVGLAGVGALSHLSGISCAIVGKPGSVSCVWL